MCIKKIWPASIAHNYIVKCTIQTEKIYRKYQCNYGHIKLFPAVAIFKCQMVDI